MGKTLGTGQCSSMLVIVGVLKAVWVVTWKYLSGIKSRQSLIAPYFACVTFYLCIGLTGSKWTSYEGTSWDFWTLL